MPFLQTASLLLGMGNLGLNLLNYLSLTQANAPVSTGLQAPYTPPFIGGQSVGIEYYAVVEIIVNNTVRYSRGNGDLNSPTIKTGAYNSSANKTTGAIPSTARIEVYQGTNSWALRMVGSTGVYIDSTSFTVPFTARIVGWYRVDGQPDTGGDLPNPNPIINNPDGGYQGSPAPSAPDTVIIDRSAESPIIPAAPAPLVPSFLSGLLALLAAAANIAELALALKNLIEQIFALLKMILDFLREFEKLLPRGKSVVSKELGAISRDGFLRLYPIDRSKHLAISLDVRFTSLPLWKKDAVLSLRSPTYYYGLGRILFVSDTMGIIKEIELHYAINSIPIPENAMGFYYHLGLDGVSVANTTCFYSRSA